MHRRSPAGIVERKRRSFDNRDRVVSFNLFPIFTRALTKELEEEKREMKEMTHVKFEIAVKKLSALVKFVGY